MKFKIDIECTPQEARDFFGLPNVEGLNKAIMDHAQETMTTQMNAMDPETFLNTWMPAGTKMMENLQKQFFSQFTGGDTDKK